MVPEPGERIAGVHTHRTAIRTMAVYFFPFFSIFFLRKG